MSSFQPIEDKVQPQPDIVYSIMRYDIMQIVPNTSARIYATLYNADKTQRKDTVLVLEQPEYANWGADDQFIEDWVVKQLGVTLK